MDQMDGSNGWLRWTDQMDKLDCFSLELLRWTGEIAFGNKWTAKIVSQQQIGGLDFRLAAFLLL